MTPDTSLFRPGGLPVGPLVGVVALAALAGFASLVLFGTEDRVEQTAPRAQAPPPPPPHSPLQTTTDELVLPPLDESDTLVRDLVAGMTSHPEIAAWLIPDDLIRVFVVVVENVADGDNPAQHLRPLRPTQRFRVADTARRLGLSPTSHARYDTHAEIVAAIDPAGAGELYRTLHPLIAQAYRELGHPDDAFDNTVRRAMINLLETPVLERQVTLIPRASFFEFADERLEELLPVQKQFLGMGPRNVRAVQASLLDIAHEIGLDTHGLPVPEVLR